MSKNLCFFAELQSRVGNRSKNRKKKKIIVRFPPPPLGVNINARSESVSINWSSKRANLNVLSDSCIGKMSVPPIDNRFVSYLTRESRDADGPLSLWKFLGVRGCVCVANSPDRWFRNSSGGYVSLVVILIFEWIHQLSLTVLLFFYSWILLSNKRRNLRRKRRILITKPSVHYYHYYYLVRSKVVNFFFKSIYIFFPKIDSSYWMDISIKWIKIDQEIIITFTLINPELFNVKVENCFDDR